MLSRMSSTAIWSGPSSSGPSSSGSCRLPSAFSRCSFSAGATHFSWKAFHAALALAGGFAPTGEPHFDKSYRGRPMRRAASHSCSPSSACSVCSHSMSVETVQARVRSAPLREADVTPAGEALLSESIVFTAATTAAT